MFGAVKLTKHNNDVGLYQYSEYGIELDRKGSYSIGDKVGRNVIIFRVNMSLSLHIENKKKDISNLGKGRTQGLEHTLAAEKLYSIIFTKEYIKFYLTLKRMKGEGRIGQFNLPSGFSKNISSKERVELWFFVTFNIIIIHIFPENFTQIPQVFQIS